MQKGFCIQKNSLLCLTVSVGQAVMSLVNTVFVKILDNCSHLFGQNTTPVSDGAICTLPQSFHDFS